MQGSRQQPSCGRSGVFRKILPGVALVWLLSVATPCRRVLASTSPLQGNSHQDDDQDCRDENPSECPAASARGECQTLHESTRPLCRKSCWLCVNATELRSEGVPDEEIERRYKYSRTDFGPLPSFPPHPDPRPVVLLTQDIMVAMDAYARQFPSSTCINNRSECPYWAATGYCEDSHFDYMIEECPLACRYCDQREAYLRCHQQVRERQEPYEQVGPRPLLKAMRKWKDRLLTSFPTKSANVLEAFVPDASYQWAVQIEDFLSDDERSSLTVLARGLSWEPSSALGYDLNATLSLDAQTNYKTKQRVRRTSTSAYCSRACLQQLPVLQVVLKRLLSALQVPLNLLEKPVEFVSYGPTHTFARHSDCRTHDIHWKVGGPRVATAYLALGDDPLYLGFPDWWEMVEVKPSQAAVWPNVRPGGESGTGITCNELSTEVLAAPGTSHGILVHVRLYPHDEVLPEQCRS